MAIFFIWLGSSLIKTAPKVEAFLGCLGAMPTKKLDYFDRIWGGQEVIYSCLTENYFILTQIAYPYLMAIHVNYCYLCPFNNKNL